MASKFNVGDTLRVKAAMFHRGPRDARVRIMRGQTFTVTEDDLDGLDRSDVDLIFEVVQDIPDQPPQEGEPTEEEVWGENIDTDELSKQLSDMNVSTAKKYLSRSEWTVEGMRIARQAEENGENRSTLLEFIDNRILDLDEMGEEGGSEG